MSITKTIKSSMYVVISSLLLSNCSNEPDYPIIYTGDNTTYSIDDSSSTLSNYKKLSIKNSLISNDSIAITFNYTGCNSSDTIIISLITPLETTEATTANYMVYCAKNSDDTCTTTQEVVKTVSLNDLENAVVNEFGSQGLNRNIKLRFITIDKKQLLGKSELQVTL